MQALLSKDRHRESMDIVPPSVGGGLLLCTAVLSTKEMASGPFRWQTPRTRKYKANTKLLLGFFLFLLGRGTRLFR